MHRLLLSPAAQGEGADREGARPLRTGPGRDSVEERVLLRELRAEEPSWVDYGQDAGVVKDRIVKSLMSTLIADVISTCLQLRAGMVTASESGYSEGDFESVR